MKKIIQNLKWQSVVAIFVISVLTITNVSCSSDDADPTPAPTPIPPKTYDIKGYYKGTLGTGTSDTGFNLILVVEEGGKITYGRNASKLSGTSMNNKIYGTYTLNGNALTAVVTATNETVTFNATYEPTTGLLTGSWSNNLGTSGKIKLQKDISTHDSISGYWKGTYTGSSTNPYTMVCETDGSITFIDGATVTNAGSSTAYGTHTLSNTSFSASYRYNYGSSSSTLHNVSATFDKPNGKLITGTWSGGTWTLSKMYN